jgi:hypothetical protein
MKTTDESNDHWCRLYFVHAMAQMVSCQPLTVEFWVQSQANPCGMCARQSGTETGFPSNTSVFLPVLFYQCSKFIHHSQYIIFTVYSIANPFGIGLRIHFGICCLRSGNMSLVCWKKKCYMFTFILFLDY